MSPVCFEMALSSVNWNNMKINQVSPPEVHSFVVAASSGRNNSPCEDIQGKFPFFTCRHRPGLLPAGCSAECLPLSATAGVSSRSVEVNNTCTDSHRHWFTTWTQSREDVFPILTSRCQCCSYFNLWTTCYSCQGQKAKTPKTKHGGCSWSCFTLKGTKVASFSFICLMNEHPLSWDWKTTNIIPSPQRPHPKTHRPCARLSRTTSGVLCPDPNTSQLFWGHNEDVLNIKQVVFQKCLMCEWYERCIICSSPSCTACLSASSSMYAFIFI